MGVMPGNPIGKSLHFQSKLFPLKNRMPTLGAHAKSVSDQLMLRLGNYADSRIEDLFLSQSKPLKRPKSCAGRVFSIDEKINIYEIKQTLRAKRDNIHQNSEGSPEGSNNLRAGDMTNIESYFFNSAQELPKGLAACSKKRKKIGVLQMLETSAKMYKITENNAMSFSNFKTRA
jgi:hypothetical protein